MMTAGAEEEGRRWPLEKAREAALHSQPFNTRGNYGAY